MMLLSGPLRSAPNCFLMAAYLTEMTAACEIVFAASCIIPKRPAEKLSNAAPKILPGSLKTWIIKLYGLNIYMITRNTHRFINTYFIHIASSVQ